jgi:nicotinic acetylcholine receptor, invertebrate
LTDSLRKSIKSNEWDLRRIGVIINNDFINSNNESRPFIKFYIKLRRKCFFHIINLVIPCICLTLMTVVVFYLSSESNEKITLSISILMALTLFFLILIETMPPTSMSIPLLGKFLLYTLAMVSLSICATIYVLSVHHRDPRLHSRMSDKMRNYFFNYLPKFIHIRRTSEYLNNSRSKIKYQKFNDEIVQYRFSKNNLKNLIAFKLVHCLTFIVQSIENNAKEKQMREEWKYFAIVLDRIFIYIFGTAFIFGICSIFLMNLSNGSDDIKMDF